MTTWQKHLETAEGYLGLGMFDDAAMALKEIAPEDQARPEVLGFRVHLHMEAKQWDKAATAARHMVEIQPENSQWWISFAYATRRDKSVEEAEKILLRAAEIHPAEAMIKFNLSCYACVTGRLEEAEKRLAEAIAIDEGMRTLALADEDLKPLWGAMALPEES